MIIVKKKGFLDATLYVAEKNDKTFSSGDVEIQVFLSEKDFREEYPSAPEFKDGIAVWEVKK